MNVPTLFARREDIPPYFAKLVRHLKSSRLSPKEREDALTQKERLKEIFYSF